MGNEIRRSSKVTENCRLPAPPLPIKPPGASDIFPNHHPRHDSTSGTQPRNLLSRQTTSLSPLPFNFRTPTKQPLLRAINTSKLSTLLIITRSQNQPTMLTFWNQFQALSPTDYEMPLPTAKPASTTKKAKVSELSCAFVDLKAPKKVSATTAITPEAKDIDIRGWGISLRSAFRTTPTSTIKIGDTQVATLPRPLLKVVSTNFDDIHDNDVVRLPQDTDKDGVVRLVDHLKIVMNARGKPVRMPNNLDTYESMTLCLAAKSLGAEKYVPHVLRKVEAYFRDIQLPTYGDLDAALIFMDEFPDLLNAAVQKLAKLSCKTRSKMSTISTSTSPSSRCSQTLSRLRTSSMPTGSIQRRSPSARQFTESSRLIARRRRMRMTRLSGPSARRRMRKIGRPSMRSSRVPLLAASSLSVSDLTGPVRTAPVRVCSGALRLVTLWTECG
jgi:hypothetical protein